MIQLSPSDLFALIGLAIGAIGSIAAIIAAVFAIRADTFGRHQAETARQQRQSEIRPRLRYRWLGPRFVQTALGFFNVGGPAVDVVWLGHSEGKLFASYTTLPQHFGEYRWIGYEMIADVADRLGRDAETICLLASDVDGAWWNCLRDREVGDPRDEIRAQLDSLKLAEYVDDVFKAGRLQAAS